ncbi:hypothetical protein EGR_01209 [Echinococcus granulosus]|uniref:Uncharacterized protein n=1 Tax=Echinococcus granulosus TaxID=6210 RepID=W6UTU7_ECHGR|nr:hypothetical protein EGR_01209 [Echinococcus granulosus]EUB64081.1 hypothetical protein EGR_01209 [Echinococcus granulosus]
MPREISGIPKESGDWIGWFRLGLWAPSDDTAGPRV